VTGDRRRDRRRGSSVLVVARKHAFGPRYRPEERLSLVTEDGVTLAGARLTGPPDAVATVVLAHGFVHSSRTPRIYAFAHLLARRVHVLIPDLRGHGSSGGLCTLGVEEPLDVAAAVDAAPPGLPVVTLGISLGGAAVLLHAGVRDDAHRAIAGVVAISPPAWSGTWDTPGTKRVARYAGSPVGRQVLARLLHTRIAAQCQAVPDARHLVAGIAPAFTLIVADPADHYFAEEHSRALYEWAREPKDLWLLPGTGHGTDLLSPALADRLLRELDERLSPDGGPAG